jgi:uncharacterized membrane protein YhdT
MYEIWLGINIFYELALVYLPLLFIVALVWVALIAYAIQKKAKWTLGIKGAVIGGIIATAIAFLSLPAITKSSLGELGYWFDYVSLLGMAGMYGVVAAALVWPLSSPKTR